jgi:antitoxin YefM
MSSRGLAMMYRIMCTENMDKIASLSHVRANLPKLVASLGKRNRDRVIITRNGAAAAVLISPEDLETLEILADRKLMLSLRKAEGDLKAGRFAMTLEAFADVDAGRVVDARAVGTWAAGLLKERAKRR